MFVSPIIDLWTAEVRAHALITEKGKLYDANTPNELYQWIDAAYERNLIPLVVHLPSCMTIQDWLVFRESLPSDMIVYCLDEDNVKLDDSTTIFTMTDQPIATKWVAGIGTEEDLEQVMKSGVRFGSGDAVATATELESKSRGKKRNSKLDIKWA